MPGLNGEQDAEERRADGNEERGGKAFETVVYKKTKQKLKRMLQKMKP